MQTKKLPYAKMLAQTGAPAATARRFRPEFADLEAHLSKLAGSALADIDRLRSDGELRKKFTPAGMDEKVVQAVEKNATAILGTMRTATFLAAQRDALQGGRDLLTVEAKTRWSGRISEGEAVTAAATVQALAALSPAERSAALLRAARAGDAAILRAADSPAARVQQLVGAEEWPFIRDVFLSEHAGPQLEAANAARKAVDTYTVAVTQLIEDLVAQSGVEEADVFQQVIGRAHVAREAALRNDQEANARAEAATKLAAPKPERERLTGEAAKAAWDRMMRDTYDAPSDEAFSARFRQYLDEVEGRIPVVTAEGASDGGST